MDTEIRVSTESWPWRRKFSGCSCGDSNSRPFNHESGALTTEPVMCEADHGNLFVCTSLKHTGLLGLSPLLGHKPPTTVYQGPLSGVILPSVSRWSLLLCVTPSCCQCWCQLLCLCTRCSLVASISLALGVPCQSLCGGARSGFVQCMSYPSLSSFLDFIWHRKLLVHSLPSGLVMWF